MQFIYSSIRTTPEQAGTTRSITFYNVYAHKDLGKPEINCPAQEMRFSLRDFFSTFKQVLKEITYVSEQGFRNHTIFKNNVLRWAWYAAATQKLQSN